MAIAELRRDNGSAPTDEQITEYWFVYRGVKEATGKGYHLPYANLHSDGDLWHAYDLGFRDAVAQLRVPA